MSSVSLLTLIAARTAAASALAKTARYPSGTPGGKGGQFAPGGGQFGSHLWDATPATKPAPPPGAKPHPKTDDKGAAVSIDYPTKSGDPAAWHKADQVATAVPGGPVPSTLGSVAFKSWVPPADWTQVEGTKPALDAADPLDVPPGKRAGAGVIILEDDGRMWVTKPTNGFGGYQHSWPKGGIEAGLTLQQTAIKEAWEETGLKVAITGVLGDYEGDTSIARYYVARRVGGTPADMGWESQAMRLVPPARLKTLLNRSRDKQIADDVVTLLRSAGIFKAVPQTLYVRRDLVNADEVIAWAKANGFATTMPAGQLHVTIAYSKAPVSLGDVGPDETELVVEGVRPEVDKSREVLRFGEAVVLAFASDDLEARWREFLDLGASWDHEDYRPHVTITWSGDGLDLADVEPYQGQIVFGPEVFEPVDEGGGWRANLIEKAKGKARGSFNASQPRWPAGTPLGGQWKATDAGGIPTPPKIAGGLEGKNTTYQKQVNALYAAHQAGDVGTIKSAAEALGAKVAAHAAKGATSSHVKWTAQVHQYAQSLLDNAAAAPAAIAAADKIRGPMQIGDLTKVGAKPAGSAPGALYTDKGAQKWLVKGNLNAKDPSSDDRAKNEVLAAHLMQAVGAGAPDMKLVDLKGEHGGGLGVASKWIDGATKFDPSNPQHVEAAQKQFAIHAWLGNWDVIGQSFDNTVITKDGKALCIDPGGAILFRAQGQPKSAAAWGPQVDELKTLRDPKTAPQAAAVYGKMTASQIATSAEQLKDISNETIAKLVDTYGPGDAAGKQKLVDTLIARREFMLIAGQIAGAAALQGTTAKVPKATKAPKATPPAPAPAPATTAPRVATTTPMVTASGIAKPTFSTGFQKTDQLYADAVGHAEALASQAAAGDKAAVLELYNATVAAEKGFATTGSGLDKIQPTSPSGKKLVGYLTALGQHAYKANGEAVAAQEAAAAAAIAAQASKADEAVKAQAFALPDFAKAKLPEANTNAGSHNAKVDAIKALAEAGDVNGLLALPFGSNTYGKKQAQLTNDALAALGSSHQVQSPQIKGAHPAIAGKTPAVPPLAEAQAGKVMPKAPTSAVASADAATQAAKASAKTQKPVFKPENLLAPPDFQNWPGKGAPLSSSPAVNAANNAAVQAIYSVAKTGDLAALKGLQFEVVSKDTGQKTGAAAPIAQHPSQHVKAYHANLVTEVDLQLHPPVPPDLGPTIRGRTLARSSGALLPIRAGEAVAAVPPTKKAGDYVILGKISQTGLPLPKEENTTVTSAPWKAKVKMTWDAAPPAAKAVWKKYLTTSGAKELNTALRAGKVSDGQLDEVKAFNALLVDIPEGTTFVRSMGSGSYGATPSGAKLKQIEQFLLNAEPGTVVQEPGFTSSSWSGAHKVLSGNKFKWKFTAGKGVRAFPAWLSQNVGEGESLFPPNQRYMIRGVKKVGATYEIDAVLLPTIEN